MMLNRHFQDFIELLARNKVRYLIVGGYAVGLHGFPRYTGDIDLEELKRIRQEPNNDDDND
jgi:hypothetical protein